MALKISLYIALALVACFVIQAQAQEEGDCLITTRTTAVYFIRRVDPNLYNATYKRPKVTHWAHGIENTWIPCVYLLNSCVIDPGAHWASITYLLTMYGWTKVYIKTRIGFSKLSKYCVATGGIIFIRDVQYIQVIYGTRRVYILLAHLRIVTGYCPGNANRLTHNVAMVKLHQAGIAVVSSGGCSNRFDPKCTSLDSILWGTISGIIKLRNACNCEIVITGGTEIGHPRIKKSHWFGFKLTLRLTYTLTVYIITHFTYTGQGGLPEYLDPDCNIYIKHPKFWEVVFP